MSGTALGYLMKGRSTNEYYPDRQQYAPAVDWAEPVFGAGGDRFSDEDSDDYDSSERSYESDEKASEELFSDEDAGSASDGEPDGESDSDADGRDRRRQASSSSARAESSALAFASSRGDGGRSRGSSSRRRGGSASSAGVGPTLSGWEPLSWKSQYLPEASIRLEWRATMSEFADGEMAGRDGNIDCSMCNISPAELTEVCRRDAPRSYSGCSREMIRVIYCRQKDHSINVVTIDIENVVSTLPFDVAIVCTNVEQLNETNVRMIDAEGNPKLRRVMFVVPQAGSSSPSSTRVTDMRRIITDPSMFSMMQIDRKEVKSSIAETAVRGDRSAFSMLKDSIVHRFSDQIYNDPSYDETLRRHAVKIMGVVKSSKGAKKRQVKDSGGKVIEVGYWYDNMPADSLRYVRDWIIDETKVITKVSELRFKIEPLGGPEMWKNPLMWTAQGGMNACFAITQIIAGGKPFRREMVDSSPEFAKMYQRVAANIRVSFL